MSDVVNKLWGFCHTLRHDGIGYLDYIEQLTFLLFLKMADERGIDLSRMSSATPSCNPVTSDAATPSCNLVTRDPVTPPKVVDCSWPTLAKAAGSGLIDHYVDVIRALGKQPGILGDIFSGVNAERFCHTLCKAEMS
jgi:type I restriction enzyme M protein